MEQEHVILVHGIWVRGYVMHTLANALREAGFTPHIFSYPSRKLTLSKQARGLADYARAQSDGRAHFVAHSMGGLILRHLAIESPELIDRAVTLCSPHSGSYLAHRLRERHLGWLMGKSWERGLDGDLPPWPESIPLGGLAGTRPMGLGHLFTRYYEANDGTVLVSETRLEAMADWRALPHSHTGMLLANDAADEAAHFLQRGCFSPL